ncbi:hypothetical protein Clacol_009059 [Clathrus columnatus]|uniref:ATPase dynein-related AAA domain-containing protein n=1 Tax=Clathrus columnatus TaxID=1419009 RepID=A0AAV5AJH4_9AGAM|nr:hypothetical protein Clacol_009059 [Clathrus columnatus]
MTFCQLINAEYEYVNLHRDVSETELKQGREIRAGGKLAYVDSAVVRAVKFGRILIVEGIEKAERGIMPLLNNLLENREINLDDGTHIIPASRVSGKKFIEAHPLFRVVAIGIPIPPYKGFPLDPPFRSRFQARFLDSTRSALALSNSLKSEHIPDRPILEKLKNIILTIQESSEITDRVDSTFNKSAIPSFPQNSLQKLSFLDSFFPIPENLSSEQLSKLILVLHPLLTHSPFTIWGGLSHQFEKAGLGTLSSPHNAGTADGTGLLGYKAVKIVRLTSSTVTIPRSFSSYLQAHVMGWDISVIPPVFLSTSTSSTSSIIRCFADILGYEVETIHLYKELGGRELLMRRRITEDGDTTWEASPLIQGALEGRLVHLSGFDTIGPTGGSIARLLQDRETELWETRRIAGSAAEKEIKEGELSVAHSSFRVIATASRSLPHEDWLTEEHATMFLTIPSQPMDIFEEFQILSNTGASENHIRALLKFAESYRNTMTIGTGKGNRKLGTRTLYRIAKRLAAFHWDDDLHAILTRVLLADFLPVTERLNLDNLFSECQIRQQNTPYYGPPRITDTHLAFDIYKHSGEFSVQIPFFDPTQDPEGVPTLVPFVEHFYDNSLQTGLMKDIAVDLEILKDHVVLLGNQGTIKHVDSPLLKAIKHGRILIIDEADKAPEHVVSIFRSLAGQNELSLPNGQRVRSEKERASDIVVHPNFRMVLLANRPGYPFLGNHFLQVLGDNFSCHSIPNPDMLSERKLLSQLAPDMNEDILKRLVGVFQDLRRGYENGSLSYPYSLRELINLVRHMQAHPDDTLETSLRNIFDFDVHKYTMLEIVYDILERHGFKAPRKDIASDEQIQQIKDITFQPTGDTSLTGPKFGKEDPNNEPHTGGNTWAGGTGGRDTAGLGGRAGYMRLFLGHDIKQVPDKLKHQVPDKIKEEAREMARKELARRLEELNLEVHEAKGYSAILAAVESHIARLLDVLESLSAKEEERVWVKRQTDGELDDNRLIDGITGEKTVYKRRAFAQPELGQPQLNGSMYRFQYDGRLRRSLETGGTKFLASPVMIMETFARVKDKRKFLWDIYGHSGDEPSIPLLEASSVNEADRAQYWKVIEKMEMISQYTFAGDHTVEAIEKAVTEVAKYAADDWFVIAITDANFSRYNITSDDLRKAINKNTKVSVLGKSLDDVLDF